MPRTQELLSSLALGALLMLVFVTGLVRTVRRADAAAAVAALPTLRRRLFFLILGIVIGAWFFTYGALSLALGV